VLGLTENYVATLHNAALRDGSAALIGQDRRGTPGKVTAEQWEQARAWRAQGVSDAETGRRLGVAHTTVSRRPGPRGQATAPGSAAGRPPAEPLFTGAGTEPEPEPEAEAEAEAEAEPGAGAGLPTGGGLPARPLPAEGALRSRYAGAMLLHAFLARAGAGTVLAAAAGGPGDATLLSAVSMCFALGAATAEQFEHLAAAEAGPLAGLAALPGLRALRPALARIADRADPVALQRLFASAMLAADPVAPGVYYVDGHFVPCTGAKPVAKGWNNKRGRAERGRADTRVTAHDGRAVCFVSGEPSGLTVTLPKALAELKKAAGPARRSWPASTAAAPTRRSSRTAAARASTGSPTGAPPWPSPPCCPSSPRPPTAAGPGRSPGPGKPRSSRTTARPGRSPCSSTGKSPCRSSHPTSRPARRRSCPGWSPGGGRRISSSTPRPTTASTNHLNAYLCDDDEYRAITRETIIRGLAGTITCTPAAITVTLEPPGAPRIARALSLLIEEINATPPAMPGDSRPITHHLAPRAAI
jgi:hypothetical protein